MDDRCPFVQPKVPSRDSVRSTDALRAAVETRLREALARAGDGAFVIDAEGRIVQWNATAERVLGHAARDVTGRPCCDVFGGYDEHGNQLCYAGCHIRTLAGRHEPIRSFVMRTRTKAGRAVWLDVSVLVLPAEDTTGPLMIHLFRDVTAAKELLTLVHERLAAAAPASNGNGNAAGELTRRELEILRLLTEGLNTAGAADKLHVSPATVRNHIQNLFAKLGVHSRLEAVAYARSRRLF